MTREKAIFRPDPFGLSAAKIASFFAELFAILDERPRETALEVELPREGEYQLHIDAGRLVFLGPSGDKALLDLSGRYLAEHPLPVVFGRNTRFLLSPTTGGRVKSKALQYRSCETTLF